MNKPKTNAVQDILALPGNPFLWALSGTPFEKTPADLTGYLQILRRRAHSSSEGIYDLWRDLAPNNGDWDVIKHTRVEDFKQIISNWGKLMRLDDPTDDRLMLRTVLEDFGGVLKKFIIRRVTETRWFGQQLTNMPPNDHADVVVDLNERYKDDMTWLRSGRQWVLQSRASTRGRKNKPTSAADWRVTSYVLRLAATFPAIASIYRQKIKAQNLPIGSTHWAMTGVEHSENNWYDEKAVSPYKFHFEELANSSNKLQWLFKEHIEKRIDRTVNVPILPAGTDTHKIDERIVILSSFPAVAYITYLVSRSPTSDSPSMNILTVHAVVEVYEEIEGRDTDSCENTKATGNCQQLPRTAG